MSPRYRVLAAGTYYNEQSSNTDEDGPIFHWLNISCDNLVHDRFERQGLDGASVLYIEIGCCRHLTVIFSIMLLAPGIRLPSQVSIEPCR